MGRQLTPLQGLLRHINMNSLNVLNTCHLVPDVEYVANKYPFYNPY